MLQVISVLGALAILGAFAANLFGWVQPSNLWYSVANFLGSAAGERYAEQQMRSVNR